MSGVDGCVSLSSDFEKIFIRSQEPESQSKCSIIPGGLLRRGWMHQPMGSPLCPLRPNSRLRTCACIEVFLKLDMWYVYVLRL
jgi:hypothetical protein